MNTTTAAQRPNPPGRAAWILLILAWVCFLVPIPGLGPVGWVLNMVAFILAIVAMSKGGTRKGLAPLLASLIASPILYFIGFAILAATAGAIGQQGGPRDGAATPTAMTAMTNVIPGEGEMITVTPPPERINVTALQLYKDYEANEIAGDARYKGKLLLISGTVQSIQSDLADEPVVQLRAGDHGSVQLSGLSIEEASSLRKGSQIKAQCTGSGETISFPANRDCSLQ